MINYNNIILYKESYISIILYISYFFREDKFKFYYKKDYFISLIYKVVMIFKFVLDNLQIINKVIYNIISFEFNY